jgi:nitrate/TMAO reductase-like tetraheme cytochrome c subunit
MTLGRAVGFTLFDVVTQKVHSREEKKGKSCIRCGDGVEYLYRDPASRR